MTPEIAYRILCGHNHWLLPKHQRESLEQIISESAEHSYNYAEVRIRCRFVLGEAAISKNAEYAERYAKHFIKGRWELGEAAISKDAEYSHYYAKYVLKSRFILGEPAICKSSEYSCLYAEHVIGGRFELGEAAISESSLYSYWYARDIIHERFVLGEAAISKDALWSFRYAVCAIRDWTPELAVMCPAWLYIYAKDVVKGRLPTVLHNKMIAFGIMDSSDKYVKRYLGSKKYCTLKHKDTKNESKSSV